ncbi:MAG: hypothetical protein ACJ77A_14565 [Actinomycetota bacterium]
MRRAFWVALGLGAGVTAAVLVSRWMRRQSERMAPANIGRQVSQGASDLGRLIRTALEEGRAAAAAREAEFRHELGS